MVAFNRTTDLPSDIDTVEELLAWAAAVLEFTLGSLSYRETALGEEFYASIKQGRALDGSLRRIFRISLELEANYAEMGNQWTSVKQISTGTIPASFKVP